MVGLPHITIDSTSRCGAEAEVTPPCRHLPPVAVEAGKSERGEHGHLACLVTEQCMCTVKRPGQRHSDAEAGESVPPRRHSLPVATETNESFAPRRAPTIYATVTSMNTLSPERMNTHMYTIAVYKRDADYVFYDHRNKNLQHKSCVEQCGEATRQRKF
jgi:hypothetical protein